MDKTNYYDFISVGDLKKFIKDIPDETGVVIPVVDRGDVNKIYGFRKVRTAGVLICEGEEVPKVLCLNGASGDQDLKDQLYHSGRGVGIEDEPFYGRIR